MELISLQSFITEYIERTDIHPDDMDETAVLSFAATAAQKLQTEKQCLHKVTIIPIKNYNAKLPGDFYRAIEAAYKGEGNMRKTSRPAYMDKIVTWTNSRFEECDIKVNIDCPECVDPDEQGIYIEVDDNWINANTEFRYWKNPRYRGAYGLNKFGGIGSAYHPEFTLMRPAQHKFFGAGYHVRGCINMDRELLGDYPIEYRIENNYIRVNVETGTVLLAYKAIPTDESGLPMIASDPEVFEAIFWDVEYKMLYRNKRKQGNYQFFMNAKQLSEFHMRRAYEKLDTITPLEWNSIIRNMFKKLPYRNMNVHARRVLADRFDGFVRGRR